jgi:DNA-binding transcriptional MerR regulator
MTIAELATLTGLSRHTLRYYERLGLVPLVAREPSSGHRRYSPSHVQWIDFLRNLRQAGMPLRDIRTYARLVAKGPGTWPARRELLAAHRARVEESIQRLREHRRLLTRKLRAGCAPVGLGNPAPVPAARESRLSRAPAS